MQTLYAQWGMPMTLSIETPYHACVLEMLIDGQKRCLMSKQLMQF